MLPLLRFSREPSPVFGTDAEVCVDSEETLQPFFLCEPPEQVQLFIVLFCVSVATGLLAHGRAASRYYGWFAGAEIAPNTGRGLGYNFCKAYGVFPIPRLSAESFQLVGWALVASLLLATSPALAPRFWLFTAFGLYFLYFGQLFCESKHGGHGSLLMPSVILLLALSGGPQSTPWSLIFIKIYLGIIYFAGALSKLVVAFQFGQGWGGSTVQAFLVDAMWSRPHPVPAVRQLLRFMASRWWLCSLLAATGLAFELGFLPLCVFGGDLGGALAAAVALSFHLGVDVLQGLDFKPFWCPVFWAFLPEFQAVLGLRAPSPEEAWPAIMLRGFSEEPCRWILSAAYVAAQLVVALRLADLRGGECLPWTCCPMFAVPRNLFGDEVRGGVLTEFDLRTGGHLDMAYNFTPLHKEAPLTEAALARLPGRVLVWGSTLHVHPLIEHVFHPEAIGKDLIIASNFEVPPNLRSRLERLAGLLESAEPSAWADAGRVQEALALQEECLRLFREDTCRTPCMCEQEVGAARLAAPAGARPALDRAVGRALGRSLSWLLAPVLVGAKV